jgi:hypothetical protein
MQGDSEWGIRTKAVKVRICMGMGWQQKWEIGYLEDIGYLYICVCMYIYIHMYILRKMEAKFLSVR